MGSSLQWDFSLCRHHANSHLTLHGEVLVLVCSQFREEQNFSRFDVFADASACVEQGATGLLGQRFLHGSPLLEALTLGHGKTLLGSAGCFVVSSLVTARLLVLGQHAGEVSSASIIAFSAGIGLITALVELIIPSPPLTLPFKRFPLGFDDNLMLPAIVAVSAQLLLPICKIAPNAILRPYILF